MDAVGARRLHELAFDARADDGPQAVIRRSDTPPASNR
jgi:hypothetical protein